MHAYDSRLDPLATMENMRNVGMAGSDRPKLSPAERIINRVDEALKKLEYSISQLEDKLSPLDCTMGVKSPDGPGEPAPPMPPSEYGSNLFCTLDSRARTIDELSNRLARLHARTEL